MTTILFLLAVGCFVMLARVESFMTQMLFAYFGAFFLMVASVHEGNKKPDGTTRP